MSNHALSERELESLRSHFIKARRWVFATALTLAWLIWEIFLGSVPTVVLAVGVFAFAVFIVGAVVQSSAAIRRVSELVATPGALSTQDKIAALHEQRDEAKAELEYEEARMEVIRLKKRVSDLVDGAASRKSRSIIERAQVEVEEIKNQIDAARYIEEQKAEHPDFAEVFDAILDNYRENMLRRRP